MPRVPVNWLDTAGGSPGQMPRINDAGTEMEYVDPPGSSSGGSGPVPLTTEIAGEPGFVWDDDNQLVMTEAPHA